MKMFASDLDRTLIYSKRALADFNQTEMDDLVGVEFKADQEAAFMTRKSVEILKSIAENMLFVPVTTRTFEQFNRVSLISKALPLTYAITSNGANIIYNGAPLHEWKLLIEERLSNECLPLHELLEKVKGSHLKGKIKIAEELFFYYILEESPHADTVKWLKEMAMESGWRTSIQGRKLYFMPNPICKGEAVKYIKEREGVTAVYGAGDSLLDHDFLKACDFSYVPSHGEIADENNEEFPYTFTKNRGVMAGEEILSEIAKHALHGKMNEAALYSHFLNIK